MTEEQSTLSIDSKIEWLQKNISRTDSYLNSANTKSTIMLTFSIALGTAICINSIHILKLGFIYQFAISISVLLLLKSSIHSLLAIRPFLTPSDKANIFSFVDITNTYRTSEEYERKINTVNKNEIIREMSSLNYALSKGLMKKYESQQKSVDSIIMSLVIMALTLLFSFNTGC